MVHTGNTLSNIVDEHTKEIQTTKDGERELNHTVNDIQNNVKGM